MPNEVSKLIPSPNSGKKLICRHFHIVGIATQLHDTIDFEVMRLYWMHHFSISEPVYVSLFVAAAAVYYRLHYRRY